MSECAEASPENLERDVRLDYAASDFERPPFRYPTEEAGYLSKALYPETDETEVHRMEHRIFNPERFFPPPPSSDFYESHPLVVAWKELKEAKGKMERGIAIVKRQHSYFQPEKQSKVLDLILRIREQIGLRIAGRDPTPKTQGEKPK